MSMFFEVFMTILNCSKLCIEKPRFPATKIIDFVAGITQLKAVHLLVSAGELKVDRGKAKFKLKIICGFVLYWSELDFSSMIFVKYSLLFLNSTIWAPASGCFKHNLHVSDY